MTTVQRMESDSPYVAGALLTFPSGAAKIIQWASDKPLYPTKDAAKEYCIAVLDQLMKEKLMDDAERTNWPSCVAAVQKVITDFNEKLLVVIRKPPAIH